MDKSIKNTISHRHRSLTKLKEYLFAHGYGPETEKDEKEDHADKKVKTDA